MAGSGRGGSGCSPNEPTPSASPTHTDTTPRVIPMLARIFVGIAGTLVQQHVHAHRVARPGKRGLRHPDASEDGRQRFVEVAQLLEHVPDGRGVDLEKAMRSFAGSGITFRLLGGIRRFTSRWPERFSAARAHSTSSNVPKPHGVT